MGDSEQRHSECFSREGDRYVVPNQSHTFNDRKSESLEGQDHVEPAAAGDSPSYMGGSSRVYRGCLEGNSGCVLGRQETELYVLPSLYFNYLLIFPLAF